jgi:hypothetical protein
VRGTPSASVGRARGPRDASGYAVHGRVTPCHMTTVRSSLPFSSGIKVTTPANRGFVQLFDFSSWRDQPQVLDCGRSESITQPETGLAGRLLLVLLRPAALRDCLGSLRDRRAGRREQLNAKLPRRYYCLSVLSTTRASLWRATEDGLNR